MRLFGLKHFYKRVTVTVDSPYLRHPIQLSHIFYIEVSYEYFTRSNGFNNNWCIDSFNAYKF